MRFEWDDRKAEVNLRKHGVSFVEAREVFLDEFGLDDYDQDHSDQEHRFVRIGMGFRNVLLVVYMVKNEQTETYRIISARHANKEYEAAYWKERQKHEK
jgi:uncharacterized DUF497 family protein